MSSLIVTINHMLANPSNNVTRINKPIETLNLMLKAQKKLQKAA